MILDSALHKYIKLNLGVKPHKYDSIEPTLLPFEEDMEIEVMLVDDEPEFLRLAERYLDEFPEINVKPQKGAEGALDRLEDEEVDCIISDYKMAEMTGFEFLEQVRDRHNDFPFIMITAHGSEEIASRAIAMDVDGYFQKGGGRSTFRLIANRVRNAVKSARYQRQNELIIEALETAEEGIGLINSRGIFIYMNESFADIFGYEKEEMVGKYWSELGLEGEPGRFEKEIFPVLEEEKLWRGTVTVIRKDGTKFTAQHTFSLTNKEDLVCVIMERSHNQE